ncbi:protein max isoform X2 [Heptranchias perlo]|uniref:protein max isoform X2 n=1 Tax=Heptranchias perlo TaxID=212740 RepID=UPI003559599F
MYFFPFSGVTDSHLLLLLLLFIDFFFCKAPTLSLYDHFVHLSVFQEEQPRVQTAADKRAHHNALERKRRDHIKDSFHSLRDSVPSLQGEKASRAQILDKATEYIQYMRRKNHTHQQDIDDLKRQNTLLEQQVRALEKARAAAQLQANFSSSDSSLYTNPKGSAVSAFDGGSDSTSESETEEPQTRKKLRMEAS